MRDQNQNFCEVTELPVHSSQFSTSAWLSEWNNLHKHSPLLEPKQPYQRVTTTSQRIRQTYTSMMSQHVQSGAYYIRAPEGSSKLHFSRPLNPLRTNELIQFSNPYNLSEYVVPVQEDLLVLFPSWLEHYTDENNNSLRTVISFNTDYSKRNIRL